MTWKPRCSGGCQTIPGSIRGTGTTRRWARSAGRSRSGAHGAGDRHIARAIHAPAFAGDRLDRPTYLAMYYNLIGTLVSPSVDRTVYRADTMAVAGSRLGGTDDSPIAPCKWRDAERSSRYASGSLSAHALERGL